MSSKKSRPDNNFLLNLERGIYNPLPEKMSPIPLIMLASELMGELRKKYSKDIGDVDFEDYSEEEFEEAIKLHLEKLSSYRKQEINRKEESKKILEQFKYDLFCYLGFNPDSKQADLIFKKACINNSDPEDILEEIEQLVEIVRARG